MAFSPFEAKTELLLVCGQEIKGWQMLICGASPWAISWTYPKYRDLELSSPVIHQFSPSDGQSFEPGMAQSLSWSVAGSEWHHSNHLTFGLMEDLSYDVQSFSRGNYGILWYIMVFWNLLTSSLAASLCPVSFFWSALQPIQAVTVLQVPAVGQLTA